MALRIHSHVGIPPGTFSEFSFRTIAVPSGTNPVADSPSDTLTLTSNTLSIVGTAATDSIAINFDGSGYFLKSGDSATFAILDGAPDQAEGYLWFSNDTNITLDTTFLDVGVALACGGPAILSLAQSVPSGGFLANLNYSGITGNRSYYIKNGDAEDNVFLVEPKSDFDAGTSGDMWYRSSDAPNGYPRRIAAGAAGTIISLNDSGVPSWTNTIVGAITIDTTADVRNLMLKGHSTQTNNIFEVQNNAAALTHAIKGDGSTFWNTTAQLTNTTHTFLSRNVASQIGLVVKHGGSSATGSIFEARVHDDTYGFGVASTGRCFMGSSILIGTSQLSIKTGTSVQALTASRAASGDTAGNFVTMYAEDGTTVMWSIAKLGALTKLATGLVTASLTSVGGKFNSDATQAGNATTTETTLRSVTIPGTSLNANGTSIRFKYSGTFAATVNTKQLKVKFGATTFFDSGALAITAATDWVIEGEIIRTSATAQKCCATLSTSSATLAAYASYRTAAETLSGNVALVITGQGTANNDIVYEMSTIDWMPA